MITPLGAKNKRAIPAKATKPASAKAHRCGCSVRSIERIASNAQLAANASRTVPVITCSFAPAIGPTTSVNAATSPPSRDPVTITPI